MSTLLIFPTGQILTHPPGQLHRQKEKLAIPSIREGLLSHSAHWVLKADLSHIPEAKGSLQATVFLEVFVILRSVSLSFLLVPSHILQPMASVSASHWTQTSSLLHAPNKVTF